MTLCASNKTIVKQQSRRVNSEAIRVQHNTSHQGASCRIPTELTEVETLHPALHGVYGRVLEEYPAAVGSAIHLDIDKRSRISFHSTKTVKANC